MKVTEVPSLQEDTDSETVEIMEGETSLNEANEIEEDNGNQKLTKEDAKSPIKDINDQVSIQDEDYSDISKEDYNKIVKLFELYDEDKNGSISSSELGNMMRSMGLFPTDDEVEELRKFMDGDGSGKIELNELVKNMAFQIQLRREVCPVDDFEEAFKVFDVDGNGTISCAEFRRILTELGQMKLTTDEVDDLISMVDVDGDNLLNYSEFVTLFTEKLTF